MLSAKVKILLRIPKFIITKEMYNSFIIDYIFVLWSHKWLKISKRYTMLYPKLRWKTRKIMLIMIGNLTIWTKSIFHIAAVFDLSILPIHNKGNIMLNGHMHWIISLTINEWLERITKILKRELSQTPSNFPVRSTKNIIKS